MPCLAAVYRSTAPGLCCCLLLVKCVAAGQPRAYCQAGQFSNSKRACWVGQTELEGISEQLRIPGSKALGPVSKVTLEIAQGMSERMDAVFFALIAGR